MDFERGFMVGSVWGWGYIINFIIKNTVRKKRPNLDGWKVQNVRGFSFPSGHALTSLVMYWSIVKYFEIAYPWAAVLYLIPIGLGASRLYLRVHDPIDVYAGWLIAYTYLISLSPWAIEITRMVYELLLENAIIILHG